MYLEKFKLDGRTAVVTGGGQGIGLACAEALGEAGARIVIADRDPAMGEAGCAGLKAKGYAAEAVIMDVTDPARVSEVAAERRPGTDDAGELSPCARRLGNRRARGTAADWEAFEEASR